MRQARIAVGATPPRQVGVAAGSLLPFDAHGTYAEGTFTWLPPVTGTVYATLLNFRGALHALGESVHAAPYLAPPNAPILYLKPVNTHAGHGAAVALPPGEDALRVGASLAIVFGRQATRVDARDALDYVAGYTVAADISVPHDSYYRPAVRQQCRDGYCPLGPWIVAAADVPNPDALAITVRVNGQIRQQNHTSNLIRPVAQLIAEVTAFISLRAGDLLLVGVPEGAPLAHAGDRIEIDIEGVGVLAHSVAAAAQGGE